MNEQTFIRKVACCLLAGATSVMYPAFSDEAELGPLVKISGASPFGALESCGNFPGEVAGAGTAFLDSEIEPWVEVNPTDPLNIVAFWQQDRWSNGGSRGNVAGVSTDGGDSWKIVPVTGLTDCSGGPWERSSDPWVSFSPDGTLHQISLVFQVDPSPDFPFGFGPNALAVSKSTDGGGTWSDPINIIEDDEPEFLSDKQSITADPLDSNFVYAAWDRLALNDATNPTSFTGPGYFARSTDGGESWEPAKVIYENGINNQVIGSQIVVGPGGRLYNFFNEIVNTRSDGTQNVFPYFLGFLISDDNGATWTSTPFPVERILSSALNTVGSVVTPNFAAPIRAASILFDVAVNPRNGTLYAVWQDARFNTLELDSIAFSQSRDGGRTWSKPIKVNQTPTNLPPLRQQAFLPSVAVNPDNSIVVTYYDFRNDENGDAESADYFAVTCKRQCLRSRHWTNEVRLTDESFDYLNAPVAGGLFLGDYMGLAADGSGFLSVFGQAGPDDPADLYFRRIGPPARSPKLHGE